MVTFIGMGRNFQRVYAAGNTATLHDCFTQGGGGNLKSCLWKHMRAVEADEGYLVVAVRQSLKF